MTNLYEERQSFGKYVSIILRHQRIILDKEFERFGFSSGQYSIFLGVAEGEGKTQKEIAKALKITKGTMTKGIQKLIYQGYVRVDVDEVDRRLHSVYLTDKGKSIVPEVYELLGKFSTKMTQGLSDEAKDTLYDGLLHMADNVMAMANDVREGYDE